MQDRLKSRVWDPQEKKMHYNDFVITSTGYVAKVETHMEALGKFIIDQTDLDFDKKMVVMQCTGLQDDNRQLVYEGDVVRFHSLAGYVTFEIKFNEEKAAFGCEDEETDFCEFGQLFDASNFIVILGNIYENPELLEGGCDV